MKTSIIFKKANVIFCHQKFLLGSKKIIYLHKYKSNTNIIIDFTILLQKACIYQI